MLTAKYVRDNEEAIRKSLKQRHSDYPLEELLDLDGRLRKANLELQKLREERNKGSEQISVAKKAGNEPEKRLLARLADVKTRMDELEKATQADDARLQKLVWNLPNTLHESVPYGITDEQNVEVRKWGETKKKAGAGHEEILTRLGLIDIEQASKVAGARFFYLKGDIALLEQSLIRFAIDELIKKKYMLIAPPLLMKREYYKGVTSFGDFEDMLYKAADPSEAQVKKDLEKIGDDLFMIATSEHPIAAMHANQMMAVRELPRKYMGVSPCFRREAGAHGKDSKGIFRVHHFYKVEQFIFSRKEDSWKMHEELIANAEELFKKMKIPYRVMNVCTGDIGSVAAKKYDLEAWLPEQGKYREMVSCSNCTDWQSRRLDTRYEDPEGKEYVHTLNSTAIATNRVIVAIVENYVNADGTITVPDALVPYMGKTVIGK